LYIQIVIWICRFLQYTLYGNWETFMIIVKIVLYALRRHGTRRHLNFMNELCAIIIFCGLHSIRYRAVNYWLRIYMEINWRWMDANYYKCIDYCSGRVIFKNKNSVFVSKICTLRAYILFNYYRIVFIIQCYLN